MINIDIEKSKVNAVDKKNETFENDGYSSFRDGIVDWLNPHYRFLFRWRIISIVLNSIFMVLSLYLWFGSLKIYYINFGFPISIVFCLIGLLRRDKDEKEEVWASIPFSMAFAIQIQMSISLIVLLILRLTETEEFTEISLKSDSYLFFVAIACNFISFVFTLVDGCYNKLVGIFWVPFIFTVITLLINIAILNVWSSFKTFWPDIVIALYVLGHGVILCWKKG